jgi:hypothetical protein
MQKSMLMKKIIIFSIAVLSVCLVGCKNYGDKVKNGHIEVYYKDGITKQEAQATADLLYRADNNKENAAKKSFQLNKQNDTINFRMVVDEAKMKTIETSVWYSMGYFLSQNVFNGKPVNVQLTDKYFKTLRNYPYQAISTTDSTAAPQ